MGADAEMEDVAPLDVGIIQERAAPTSSRPEASIIGIRSDFNIEDNVSSSSSGSRSALSSCSSGSSTKSSRIKRVKQYKFNAFMSLHNSAEPNGNAALEGKEENGLLESEEIQTLGSLSMRSNDERTQECSRSLSSSSSSRP